MTNTESTIPSHLKDLLDRSSIHLNSDQTGALRDLLTRYKTIFSQSSGHTNLAKHNINTGTVLPIRRPCRRLPIGMREIEKEELQKMIDRGIHHICCVSPPQSRWVSRLPCKFKVVYFHGSKFRVLADCYVTWGQRENSIQYLPWSIPIYSYAFWVSQLPLYL